MRFIYVLLAIIPLLAAETTSCNKKSNNSACLKGRLEIKGICSNYVITIIDGPVDTSRVVANWTDPETNKMYKNVFALGSPCTFPAAINEGEEFYFEYVTETKEDCAVCLAFRPVPEKNNMIKVLESPCADLR